MGTVRVSGRTGDTTASPIPVAVTGGLNFVALTAGGGSTCGVTDSGTGYCWGSNFAGKLGDGTTTDRSAPVPIDQGTLLFRSVEAAENHTCAVTTTDAAYCWGYNAYGSLGLGSSDLASHSTPEAVSGGLSFVSLSGGVFHMCGVTTDSDVYCWGGNGSGELGIGVSVGPEICEFSADCSATPVAVVGGLVFSSVAALGHTCGLASGIAYCWGDNNWGKLGDGTTIASSVPVRVFGQQ